MKIPRDLSGHDLVTALCRHWSYTKVNQVGGHIIHIILPLRVGTLNSILSDVANHKGVDRQTILDSLV